METFRSELILASRQSLQRQCPSLHLYLDDKGIMTLLSVCTYLPDPENQNMDLLGPETPTFYVNV
jgi:hypothetical protein